MAGQVPAPPAPPPARASPRPIRNPGKGSSPDRRRAPPPRPTPARPVRGLTLGSAPAARAGGRAAGQVEPEPQRPEQPQLPPDNRRRPITSPSSASSSDSVASNHAGTIGLALRQPSAPQQAQSGHQGGQPRRVVRSPRQAGRSLPASRCPVVGGAARPDAWDRGLPGWICARSADPPATGPAMAAMLPSQELRDVPLLAERPVRQHQAAVDPLHPLFRPFRGRSGGSGGQRPGFPVPQAPGDLQEQRAGNRQHAGQPVTPGQVHRRPA